MRAIKLTEDLRTKLNEVFTYFAVAVTACKVDMFWLLDLSNRPFMSPV